eukprot:m.353970 g.353970  ORF g.353970 m.353970 type:complete len:55 (+) comp16874_c0_seq1:82-246(+)
MNCTKVKFNLMIVTHVYGPSVLDVSFLFQADRNHAKESVVCLCGGSWACCLRHC